MAKGLDVWHSRRYARRNPTPSIFQQIERAGWLGFFLGFLLGMVTVILILPA